MLFSVGTYVCFWYMMNKPTMIVVWCSLELQFVFKLQSPWINLLTRTSTMKFRSYKLCSLSQSDRLGMGKPLLHAIGHLWSHDSVCHAFQRPILHIFYQDRFLYDSHRTLDTSCWLNTSIKLLCFRLILGLILGSDIFYGFHLFFDGNFGIVWTLN